MTGKGFNASAAVLTLAIAACGAASLVLAQTQPAPAAVVGAPAAPKPAPGAVAAAKPIRATDKTQWKDLSLPQQVALDPLKAEWNHMEAVRKQKWLDIANRYSSMKPDEQQRVQERMRAWLKLTPEERRVARENYTLSKKIDKGQKSAQWEQYQQLPDEEKRKLADAAATKKQVTNLPPKSQPKAIAPIKPNPAVVCAAGTVKNPHPGLPACLPAPAPAAAPVIVPPLTIIPPGTPAAPVPNAK